MPVTVDVESHLPLIQEIQLFRYLTHDELEKFVGLSELVAYDKGEKIIHLGDVSPYFYGIVKGGVHVSLRELNGQDVFICSVRQGEVFGESAIFMAEKRTADVTSSDPTVLLRIHRRDMMAFIKDNPSAGNRILMLIIYSLLKKLRDANQELAFEKQSVIDLNDIDALVKEFITPTD